MGAVAKAAPDIAQAIRAASANSVDASKATVDTAKGATALLAQATEAIGELHATLTDLHASVNGLTASADTLMASSDATIKSAGLVMANLVVLEKTLNEQIAAQAPEAGRTLAAMAALLEDPALQRIIAHVDATSANVEKGTKHLGETAETIDIATRDLRKKAGQVKFILSKLLGLIKFTVPLF